MDNMPTFLEDCISATRKQYQPPIEPFTDPSRHPDGSLIRTLFDAVASLRAQISDPQSALAKQHEAALRAFLDALFASLRKSKARSASGSASTSVPHGRDARAHGRGDESKDKEDEDVPLLESLDHFGGVLKSKLTQWSHEFEHLAKSESKFVVAVCEIKYYQLCFAMFEAYVKDGGKKGKAFMERMNERESVVGAMKDMASKNHIVVKHDAVKRKESKAFLN